METENIWAFFRSESFQLLIDNPGIYIYEIIEYFNRTMDEKLREVNITNIEFYMRAIERSDNGYYFKFNLNYGNRDDTGLFNVEHRIFDIAENFHISFHQRHPVHNNQTHLRANRNGYNPQIHMNFSRGLSSYRPAGAEGRRAFYDILLVIISEENIIRFCDRLGLRPGQLSNELHISYDNATQLVQNIQRSILIMSRLLTKVFTLIDDISLAAINRSIWIKAALQGRGNLKRKASHLAGGGNISFFNKYMKYKLKYLELSREKKINFDSS